MKGIQILPNNMESQRMTPSFKNTNELIDYVLNDLNPRVDTVGRWAKFAVVGALVGGFSTLGLFVLELINLCLD